MRLWLRHGKLMSRRLPQDVVVLLGCTAWAITTACRAEPNPPSSADSFIVDAAGVAHVFDQPARRIVSLVPSATATLRAIGANDVLVGRTDFDDDESLLDLPSVGGGLDPNLEAIVALRPDLVIRFAGEQDTHTPSRLDALGIRHIAVRPDHVEDIYETAAIVGHATGYTSAADSLVQWIRDELSRISGEAPVPPKLRIAYVLGGSPPWVAGPDTYISEVISIIGGQNVFEDLPASYTSVSREEFRSRNIDLVLTSAEGDFDECLTPGTRIEVVGTRLEIPGPGIVEVVREIAKMAHRPRQW